MIPALVPFAALIVASVVAAVYIPENDEVDFGDVTKTGCDNRGGCQGAKFRLLIQVSDFAQNLTLGYWESVEIKAKILDGKW